MKKYKDTKKLITIREETEPMKIINDLNDVLIKYNLTYVEAFGVLELFKIVITENLHDDVDIFSEEDNDDET